MAAQTKKLSPKALVKKREKKEDVEIRALSDYELFERYLRSVTSTFDGYTTASPSLIRMSGEIYRRMREPKPERMEDRDLFEMIQVIGDQVAERGFDEDAIKMFELAGRVKRNERNT